MREDTIAAAAGGDNDNGAYQKDIADALKKCLENEKVESGVLLAIDEACSKFSITD